MSVVINIFVHKIYENGNKFTWFYACNFIAQWSPKCFGHSCGHLQGGENKNTNIIILCPNHSTILKIT